jgi:hypothetical protein
MLDKPLVNWPTFCYFLRQERIFGLSPDNISDDLGMIPVVYLCSALLNFVSLLPYPQP